MAFIRTERSTSLALVSLMSVTLKTELGFLADWANALPLSEAATFHSPTSLENPLAMAPVSSSSKVQVRLAPSPASRGPAKRVASARPLIRKLKVLIRASLSFSHCANRYGQTRWNSAPPAVARHPDRSRPEALGRDERGEVAQHAGDRPLSLIEVDQVVGREPARLPSAAERLQGSGVESPGREDSRRPVQHLRRPVADGLGRQAVAGDSTEVVDPRLITGPALQAIVQQELEPEQEEGVEIRQPVGALERLVFQPAGLLGVQLDRRRDHAPAVGPDRFAHTAPDLPEPA